MLQMVAEQRNEIRHFRYFHILKGKLGKQFD